MKTLKNVILAFAILFGVVVVLNFGLFRSSLTGRGLTYHDASYTKNFSWQGVEVGIVYRQPDRSIIMRGRHRGIIAFPEGHREQARLMHVTLLGESAPPLEFVSATGAKGTYRTREGEMIVDAATWEQKPLLSGWSPPR